MPRAGATVDKPCDLIREAVRNGARFIVLPEGLVPGFPHGHPVPQRSYRALFDNALEIPSPAIARRGW